MFVFNLEDFDHLNLMYLLKAFDEIFSYRVKASIII